MPGIDTIKDFFGEASVLQAADPKPLGLSIPALTARQFEFFTAKLPHINNPVLCVAAKEVLPLRIIENTYQRLQQQHEGGVVFYFDKLSTRDRQRLISRNVQFIVNKTFLFAPLLGIAGAMKNFVAKEEDLIQRQELSPIAETILIGQILDSRYEGLAGNKIAESLQVTPATISQALKELEKQGLVHLNRSGKAKSANFKTREPLWREVLKILNSPVEATLEIEAPPTQALSAGLSALAKNSMLADPEMATWAVYKRNFESKAENFLAVEPLEKPLRLELWRRDPQLLAQNGIVDPISLYFSLKDVSDERVQNELDEMLTKLGLEEVER